MTLSSTCNTLKQLTSLILDAIKEKGVSSFPGLNPEWGEDESPELYAFRPLMRTRTGVVLINADDIRERSLADILLDDKFGYVQGTTRSGLVKTLSIPFALVQPLTVTFGGKAHTCAIDRFRIMVPNGSKGTAKPKKEFWSCLNCRCTVDDELEGRPRKRSRKRSPSPLVTSIRTRVC